jgi:hypothetical protein
LKPQVVIDSNVWISGIVFGGNPEKVIRLFVEGHILLITSEELLSELRKKITQRFPLFIPNVALLEASIGEDAIMVQLGSLPITASRDVDDNKFLETAMIGNAQYIVCGDGDLLDLKTFRGIEIVKPIEFLKLLSL